MIKKILLLNIALFLFCSTSYGQYSLYKLQKEKKSDKKEVKKPDEIENKTKGCELYEGLFNIYQNIINNNISKCKEDTLNVKKLDLNFMKQIVEIILKNNVNDYNKIKNIINNVLIFKCYNISTIIELLVSNILPNIKNKYLFIDDIISLNINKNNNSLNDDIILFDTIILCIYKHL